MGESPDREVTDGVIPEQLSLLPPAVPSITPKKTRKRTGGKRKVPSCTGCRAAHLKCVADRLGVPCERCAKKSWSDCTLMQVPEDEAPVDTLNKSETINPESRQGPEDEAPAGMLNEAEAMDPEPQKVLEEEAPVNMLDESETIDPESQQGRILRQTAITTLAYMKALGLVDDES
ncbi:hypothetical protein F5Y19DRAFT_480184 [Xylariaceae sp. FL1651]|nr:hypothetical protein F5Y19DRAFT_480184 [Xylariaceae sp. FL1651]